tara:strand:+ start:876 stop:1334 length:459 start_codon:yes stop_codon:yes gene_type:complete
VEQFFSEINFETSGEGFINITSQINKWIASKKINAGIIVISIKHTSCSLTVNENADPKVLKDLSAYMKAIVPEKNFRSINGLGALTEYKHSEEGIDDMPAHIRTMLTCTNLSFSIKQGEIDLGIWQAIYLWEHRYSKNLRKLSVHAICETFK